MSEIAALSATDLQALRLATQVFRHKASLQGSPAVERYWADFGRAVDYALAAKGIGFVVGRPPTLSLEPSADDGERRLLADHLRLLADNDHLSGAIRELCSTLRQRVAD